MCLSVCEYYEFFTQSSLNHDAVSQQSLNSLSAVFQLSLSTISRVSCFQLHHSLHCSQNILHYFIKIAEHKILCLDIYFNLSNFGEKILASLLVSWPCLGVWDDALATFIFCHLIQQKLTGKWYCSTKKNHMFRWKIIINQEIFIFHTLKKGSNYTLINLSFFLLSFQITCKSKCSKVY